MKSNTAQNLLHLGLIALIAIALVLLSPRYKYDVAGIFLPSGQQAPAVKTSDVKTANMLPPSASTIGYIHTSTFPGNNPKNASGKLYRPSIQHAKALAAAHGANVIAVTSVIDEAKAGPINIYQLAIDAGRVQK